MYPPPQSIASLHVDTISCSERSRDCPVSIRILASRHATPAKAVQSPHCCLFIGVILFVPLLLLLVVPPVVQRVMRSRSQPQLGVVEPPPYVPPSASPAQPPIIQPPPAQPPPPRTAVFPPSAPAMLVCRHCGHALRPGAKFCSGCGQPVGDQPAPSPTHCPQCGNPLRSGAKFCGQCGARL